jgi:hypothetical protein
VPSGTKQWDLVWTYSCPGASGSNFGVNLGNFVLLVYKGRTHDTHDPGATDNAATGQGTQHYSDTGAFSLHVGAKTGCAWTVNAIVPSS